MLHWMGWFYFGSAVWVGLWAARKLGMARDRGEKVEAGLEVAVIAGLAAVLWDYLH